MGFYETTLEMLFVDNQYRGKGIGKELVTYAIQRLGINKVDVNEQNIQAVGFYQHIGFNITGKDDRYGEDKAYPHFAHATVVVVGFLNTAFLLI